ncbi:MAG: DsbE family thiol:disulfide interchange protein [Candidatus Pelagibacter sp. TMED253]|nr:MAG: DsbE family thiol:disulfide interchange protein [Candidatus Pelagibacter sp. TMED253]
MQTKIIKIFTLSIAVFIIVVFFIGLNKNSIYDTKDLVGQKISKVRLNHFNDDKIITLEDFQGNSFTLINFWASWCGPCRDEHPFLLRLSEEKKLKLLGVNFKDKKDKAIKFLNNLGNPYDYLARDDLGKQSVNLGIYGIPESILINKELIIIKKFIGPISENDYDYIKNILRK